MAFEDLDMFSRLVAKANLIAERYEILAESHNRAKARIEELEGELDASRKELQKLNNEVEYLRMATVILPNREQIEQTRAIISGLVREIDRCITELSD